MTRFATRGFGLEIPLCVEALVTRTRKSRCNVKCINLATRREKNAARFPTGCPIVKLTVEKLHFRAIVDVNVANEKMLGAKWYRRKYDETEKRNWYLYAPINRTGRPVEVRARARFIGFNSRGKSRNLPCRESSRSRESREFSHPSGRSDSPLACVTLSLFLDFASPRPGTFIKSPDLLSFQRSARPTGAARCRVPTVENAWRPEATPLSVSARSAIRAISARPGWTCR